jgi:hypothetical protein
MPLCQDLNLVRDGSAAILKMGRVPSPVVMNPKNEYLVGGFNPSEKYQSVGMIIPNIWKNKKCSKPPTNNQIFTLLVA